MPSPNPATTKVTVYGSDRRLASIATTLATMSKTKRVISVAKAP
jgi:hypothetical protein